MAQAEAAVRRADRSVSARMPRPRRLNRWHAPPEVDGMFVGEPEDAALQLAQLPSIDRARRSCRPDLAPRRQHRRRIASTAASAGSCTMPSPGVGPARSRSGYALPLVNQPYVIVETSRGCPYSCDFCVAPIHQGHKFRERSAKALVDEIERSYRELGVEFFYLWGDTVTLNVKSFTAFCDELIARKLPIQWFGNARADNLTDPAFVHRLKRAGCWMLALGHRDRIRRCAQGHGQAARAAEDRGGVPEHARRRHQVVRVLHLRISR